MNQKETNLQDRNKAKIKNNYEKGIILLLLQNLHRTINKSLQKRRCIDHEKTIYCNYIPF